MDRSHIERLQREEAENIQKQRGETERNPLSQYSTSELKAELRRRKCDQ